MRKVDVINRAGPRRSRPRRGIRPVAGAIALLALPAAVAGAAAVVPGDIMLASTSDRGVKGNRFSENPSLSADGIRVAFSSQATNFDPADRDELDDVYVKDLATGEIALASVSDRGVKGNDASFNASLSADGTRVAFGTWATNLDPRDQDFEVADVYVKDVVTGDLILASASETGVKGDRESFDVSLSADGSKVAFRSYATNLDPADPGPASSQDVYVKSVVTGDIVLASTSDGGVKGNFESIWPWLSRDGSKVAFESGATNLDPSDRDRIEDIYVKDVLTGDIALASTSDSGVKGNAASTLPSPSGDGSKVAFLSRATNLDPTDRDPDSDIYVKDLLTGEIVLASTSDTGVKGNGASCCASLSADGSKVTFQSDSTNLDPADRDEITDVYVKDLVTGDIMLASTSDAGVKGNGASAGFRAPSLSADGSKVAFASLATNFDPRDTDPEADVYVKTLVPSGQPPQCHGRAATIVGSEGDDVLVGTHGDDVIVGLGGNDHVAGGAGNDIVCGGAGRDTLAGDGGRDSLFGDEGDDGLNGGRGVDALDGGGASDSCRNGEVVRNCET